ncbi:hypothetical protein [Streptomyces collinus]|uniref:hypothetical protein n=1 Tax=Streptomyces collinus TaxID=42684 RepID=UPI0036BD58A2
MRSDSMPRRVGAVASGKDTEPTLAAGGREKDARVRDSMLEGFAALGDTRPPGRTSSR